jgi:solute:Na+ symporter, SSS family
MRTGLLTPLGPPIFITYLAAVLFISWKSRQRWPDANDYLNASRTLPLWASALSFLAYNCGSIEVIAMSAMAAQYGVQALHFYWIGGIPGMLFMGIVVLPVYMRTGARSLPEYLGQRFGSRLRLLNALLALAGTLAYSGVALYTIAEVLHVLLGWNFLAGGAVCAAIVLAYASIGGLRASVFTSIFQLLVVIAGLAPLLFMTIHFNAATWAARSDRWHLWKPLPALSPSAPLDQFGVLAGLAFVVSFSYWCTDFVMIQRALTARTVNDARLVPVLAGFGKLAIAFLVVLPGVAAPSLLAGKATFDQTMPALMALEYGPVLLALGAAALLAGLMAWLAGNVSGFSALWVEEIYRRHLRPRLSEAQYIWAGRLALLICLLAAQIVAYATFFFHDMMEFLQLIVALFYAPIFAAVLAGVLSKHTSQRGAFAGICAGVISGFAFQAAFWAHIIHFGSQMSADFYTAVLSFSAAAAGCALWRQKQPGTSRQPIPAVPNHAGLRESILPTRPLLVLSASLLALCLLLNALWW